MAAGELMVIDVVTWPSGMPSKRVSMSRQRGDRHAALPHLAQRQRVVGVAPHQGRAGRRRPRGRVTPCSSRYLKRALVWRALPKPANWRMVQTLPRYMVSWTPRVNGNWPGIAEIAVVVEVRDVLGPVQRLDGPARDSRGERAVRPSGASPRRTFSMCGRASRVRFSTTDSVCTVGAGSASTAPLPGVLRGGRARQPAPAARPVPDPPARRSRLRRDGRSGCGLAHEPVLPVPHQLGGTAAVQRRDHRLARAERLQGDEAVVLVPGREEDGAAARVVRDQLPRRRSAPSSSTRSSRPSSRIRSRRAGPRPRPLPRS